jgi:hypothetical protein
MSIQDKNIAATGKMIEYAARMPMIAITTKSSMSVNPFCLVFMIFNG